jgi:hypothetical protein
MLEQISEHIQVMVPFQVLADVDQARNPMQLTRERLERTATENQFMNGKIAAIQVGLNENTSVIRSRNLKRLPPDLVLPEVTR